MSHFNEAIGYFRRKRGLKQAEIAEFVGVSAATWSDYERGKTEPNFDVLRRISEFFKVGTDDLLTEKYLNAHLIESEEAAEKQVKSTPKSTPKGTPNVWSRPPKLVTVDSAGNDNIVLVPLRARAGYLAGYEDPEFIQNLPSYRLPGLSHGTFRMFEVYGHSMVPTFHESDTIICRYVDNLLEIRDDRVYVVVTHREGVVVKRVVNRVQKDGKLILNSDNQRHAGEYPPIVLNPEEILEVWNAVIFMSRQMRAPGEMYNRLIEVESRLTILEDTSKKYLTK